MRYLSKIIFLNSAHIPYAEVKLDGNVHFIGTQGVGKSTLLRALLFFYNADKLKLGIPKEKKSFDAFYFPYSNSYIVYEVMRENGAYCVVAAKSQGRVAFRFVDAPFERDWFINEHHEVYPEWARIRERIGGKRQVTAQISVYEMYRDIIFGNNRKQDMMPYRKFAIVESAKYQNIPRTIQNVFLNSKLDADFIKDTIIRSMVDEDVFIDLSFYRSQIQEFEHEYNDVMRWFTRNKNGEIPVRKVADKVINAYRDLIYLRKQMDEERAELNYAEKRALQEVPYVREKIHKTEEERRRSVRLIEELREKYNKERDMLIGDIRDTDTLLKKTRDKRREYELMQIEEIVKRVMQEDTRNSELERLSALKAELTRAYEDVLTKYRSMFESLDAGYEAFRNSRQTRIHEKRTALAARHEEALLNLRSEEEAVRSAYEERLEAVNGRCVELRDEQLQVKLKLQKTAYEEPYKKEISDCMASIDELRKNDKELELLISRHQMEANRLRNECGLKRKELEMEARENMEAVRKEKAAVEELLKALDSLIEKRKGSFCEWLEANKPGWQQTIGKVADEEQVLYNQELNPQLTADAGTFFGVSLNLSALERNIRNPEEMKQERAAKQEVCRKHGIRLTRMAEELNENIERLEKKYSKQIREIADAQHLKEAERLQIPQKLKHYEADLATWKTKEAEWKRIRMDELQESLNEISHRMIAVNDEKKKYQTELEKRLKACQKNYKDAKAALQEELNLFVADIQQEINRQKQLADDQRNGLKRAQEAELGGKGADTSTIRLYETRIEEVRRELKYISDHRSQVVLYERDKQELFDKEPAVRNRKKELETKLSALNERFDLRREKLQLGLKGYEDTLNKLKQELQTLEAGLAEADAFLKDETFCPAGSMEVGEKPTRRNCDAIVKELKAHIFSSFGKTEDFKKAVLQFNSYFSAKNTFHFRTELISEQDYYDFASNLCEFVDNDKISDYQKHISKRYIDIIRRISKEVGDLTRNESEIHKTIDAINKDFVERNFAGVIREIALRPLASSDRLMQLLLEIKRFNDENQHNMGEADLFSQASREDVNASAVRYLLSFMKHLLDDPGRKQLALADTFKLEFRVKENDNDTGWVEKIANVGSDGTDILVKAMVNIMLINVFKEKASRKFGDFKIHCMMDEIGKLHPNNVKGILDFANCRNILLVNSSPTTYNVEDYKYTYLLNKDGKSNTQVIPLLTSK